MGDNAGREGRAWRQLRRDVIAASGGVCGLCGKPLPMDDVRRIHLDHITPIAFGGSVLDPSNVRAVHDHCNLRRGVKPDERPRSRVW